MIPRGVMLGMILYETMVANQPALLLARSRAKRHVKDHKGAAKDRDRAIKLDPECAEAYDARGRRFYERAQFQKAKPQYLKAIELGLRSESLYAELAQTLMFTGDYTGAQKLLDDAIAEDPNSLRLYQARAEIRRLDGDKSGALADIEQAMRLVPPALMHTTIAARFSWSKEKNREAIAEFEKAIKLEKAGMYEAFSRAKIKEAQGDREGAANEIKSLLDPNSQILDAEVSLAPKHAPVKSPKNNSKP